MLKYIIKRLLIFIPTLIAISLLTFVISINAPGDPVESMLNQSIGGGEGRSGEKLAGEKAYNELRHQLGLDLPLFYFSFTNATYPDTLYKIQKKSHRENLQRVAYQYGNWNNVASYYNALKKLETKTFEIEINETTSSSLRKVKDAINELYINYEQEKLMSIVNDIEFEIFKQKKNTIEKYYGDEFPEFRSAFEHMIINPKIINRYIPVIHWYGFNNQYHNWISGFLVGDYQ